MAEAWLCDLNGVPRRSPSGKRERDISRGRFCDFPEIVSSFGATHSGPQAVSSHKSGGSTSTKWHVTRLWSEHRGLQFSAEQRSLGHPAGNLLRQAMFEMRGRKLRRLPETQHGRQVLWTSLQFSDRRNQTGRGE